MYKTKYQIFFRDVENLLYTIEIKEDNYNGNVIELTGGVSPFIINYDNNNDFLYNPIRFCGATLKVVGNDYLQSLFSTNYQQYKVNLINNTNSILFTGFITPEIYSQEYSGFLFNLEIEIVSALATLEYIKFEKTSQTISLFQLIKDSIIKSKGDYNNIYIPVTYGTSTSNILDSMTISSLNFVDEENENMSYKEILEEICKFLGWTITERDGNIYFIDVDYIKNKNNTYFKYNSLLTTVSVTTLSNSEISVQNIGSQGIDNSLSIIGGYNKINVIDSDYEIDNEILYPELKLNFNNDIPLATRTATRNNNKYYKQYFNSNEFKTFNYKLSGSTYVPSDIKFDNISNQSVGAFTQRMNSYNIDNKPNKLNWETVFEIKQYADKSEDGTKADFLYQYSDADILSKYPMISTTSPSPVVLFDTETKLCINFQMKIITTQDGFADDYKPEGGKDWNADEIYILCRLRIGTFYYNGITWNENSNNFFKLYTDVTKKNWFNVWLNCKDTNSFESGAEELNGTLINIDRTLFGEMEMILYNPKHMLGSLIFFGAPTYFFLKDIEIQSQRVNLLNSEKDDKKRDTIYSNVVNELFINECEDIELKITSKNDSELSFSKVMLSNSILNTISNVITNTNEKPEKIIIQRVINQYKQPKLKLIQKLKTNITPFQLITDNYLLNKKFIIVNENIDYMYNVDEITMIELN